MLSNHMVSGWKNKQYQGKKVNFGWSICYSLVEYSSEIEVLFPIKLLIGFWVTDVNNVEDPIRNVFVNFLEVVEFLL